MHSIKWDGGGLDGEGGGYKQITIHVTCNIIKMNAYKYK